MQPDAWQKCMVLQVDWALDWHLLPGLYVLLLLVASCNLLAPSVRVVFDNVCWSLLLASAFGH